MTRSSTGRPIVSCDCASPAHCLEATGGEQGLTADELELVRLRGEVAELRRERDRGAMTSAGPELQMPHADCGRCAHWLSWECVDCDRNRGGTSDRFEARSGEQSPTSDELEIDRLRLEVAALTARVSAGEAEVDRLRRLVTAAADALSGLLSDVAALGFQLHPRVAVRLHRIAHDLHRMARDLRSVLDQRAPR